MPFCSIKSTVLECTDTLHAALRFLGICQAWALRRFNKCTINFLPSCLQFLNPPLPPTRTPFPNPHLSPTPNSPLLHSLIQFRFGALTLFDGFCPIRCGGDRMSALSGSSSQCLWKTKTVPHLRPVSHYPSFCLACNECRLTFTLCSPEMNWNHSSYPQIPFPQDLIVDTKGPITLFLYSLSLEYKGILKALALLWWIKSTWGWKLYIWYLWMNVSNFTQIRVINFDGCSGISLLRFCHSLLHIVYWFSFGCD